MKFPAWMLATAAITAPLTAHAASGTEIAAGNTLLSLNAEGKSTRTPDLASFSSGVNTQGKNAGAAMSANSAAMNQVIAAPKAAGIADRDIQTSNIALSPLYEDISRRPNPQTDTRPARIIGYNASNTVQIRCRDLANMGRVIDALVAAGANEINGPNFGLDKPEAALDEARISAMKALRARADLYAKAAGLRVLRFISISESGGYEQPRPMMAMARMAMADSAAPTPVAAGEVSMNINLSAQVELAP